MPQSPSKYDRDHNKHTQEYRKVLCFTTWKFILYGVTVHVHASSNSLNKDNLLPVVK
jgi:hypothetical protein